MSFKKIHLTELNEFLADSFLEYNANFEVELKDCSLDGFINIKRTLSGDKFCDENIDFDLSGSECSGMENMHYSDFMDKAIYTSSPYELTEFLLNGLSYLKMLICLKDGSWVVQILDCKGLDM